MHNFFPSTCQTETVEEPIEEDAEAAEETEKEAAEDEVEVEEEEEDKDKPKTKKVRSSYRCGQNQYYDDSQMYVDIKILQYSLCIQHRMVKHLTRVDFNHNSVEMKIVLFFFFLE